MFLVLNLQNMAIFEVLAYYKGS